MAIQNRKGKYEDFNPEELLAGEFAIVQEGDPASTTGRSVYICFEPGVVKRIADYEDIGDEIAEAAGIYIDDLRDVVNDATSATTAAETATEDANTAAEAARQAAAGDVSLKTVTFTVPSSESDLVSGDSLATLTGKVQKHFDTHKVANNVTTTSDGYVLDAKQGKVINDKIVNLSLNTNTLLSATPVGIFTNQSISAIKVGRMAIVSGYVDVGSVQSAGGYPPGTEYTIATLPFSAQTGTAVAAYCTNSSSEVNMYINGNRLIFKSIINSYPDIIFIGGAVITTA